jgi:DNA repair exonuclease SbcCD ATPase subunit
MSEFIHKALIAKLNQSNSELTRELESLRNQIQAQKRELEHVRANAPDEAEHLKKKIKEYEQRETEYQQHLASISKAAENARDKEQLAEQFLSALPLVDAAPVATAIERYYRKSQSLKIIIAFLSGVLVTLGVWLVSDMVLNDRPYSAILKKLIEDVSRLTGS